MARVRPSLFSLPQELIEEIIIISAYLGDIRIVATLSQTCHFFRSLVYHQSHRHIWREVFLVVFDDPRPALNLRIQGRAPLRQLLDPNDKGKCKSGPWNCLDFPWEDEYKQRIWTEAFIFRRACPPRSSDLTSTDAELCVALEALLSVISTAAPLPYDTIACCLASQLHPCGQQPHPVFSPLLVAAHAQPSLVLRSRNTAWLMRVLAHGLPCALMARLTVFDEDGKANVQKTRVKWDGLLAKLVAQIGLMTPVRSTPCTSERLPRAVVVSCKSASGHDHPDAAAVAGGSTTATTTAMSLLLEDEVGGDGCDHRPKTRDDGNRNHDAYDLCGSSDDDNGPDFEPEPEGESTDDSDEESEIDGDHVLGTTATPATIPQDGVRRMARIRVYNMAYLNPVHAFGPFLRLNTHQRPSSTTDQRLSSGAAGEDDDMGALESPSNASPPVSPIPDTNVYLSALACADGSDIDDADFLPIAEEDDGESDDNDEEMNVSPSKAHEGGNGPTSEPSKRGPRHAQEMSGEQLRFDWAWIAAARQVIELNLRDLLVGRHQGVLSALLSLEGLRACSAPGFPASAPPEATTRMATDEPAFEDGGGWDWAGVEGQWRRCICWLDYNDLLRNNAKPLSKRFGNPALYEVMRIIPLTLCITHYSRAPEAWPGRPTIHIAGDWHTAMAEPELARVRGTVEMTASGDIRWTMVSFREDGEGEWATEGVQLGGRGSAMGVIGMWTGAEHEHSDPLGPFWAWKVGPANVATAEYTGVGGSRNASGMIGGGGREAAGVGGEAP